MVLAVISFFSDKNLAPPEFEVKYDRLNWFQIGDVQFQEVSRVGAGWPSG